MHQDDAAQKPRPRDAGATHASSHRRLDRPLARAFGIGALAGMVLLGLVWVTVSAVSHDPASAGREDRASLTDQSLSTTGRPPGPTPVQRCARVAGALLGPLQAAGPALDQWQVHVGAMNKLVVGAITLQQATAFWNQTRVGAKARIADFDRADQVARQLDVTCPMGRPRGGRSAALRACVQQVRADTHAVSAARTAVHTWEMHVGDMERLRSGTLSPAAATRMWLSMWQRGVRELHSFHVAARRARHHDNCYVPVG
jgi:hypothetical protein